MRPVVLVGLAVAGLAAGCSSSGSSSGQAHTQASPRPSVACPAALRAAFARGAAPGTVSIQTDVTAGLSTCGYRTAAVGASACTAATVTINTNPQPFKDFQRWVVETGQNSVTGPGLSPIAVSGIGIEADWVPGTLMFETANNERWVAVQLTCPTSGRQSESLAAELARAAMAAPS